jgi:hypothetical protein
MTFVKKLYFFHFLRALNLVCHVRRGSYAEGVRQWGVEERHLNLRGTM